MIGHRLMHGQIRPLLLAILAVVLFPVLAHAETVYIRNECAVPIVIQAGSVVRGVLRRDPPCALKPGDITPAIMLPGNKLITIYDARTPNLILFQTIIPGAADDHSYGIAPDGPRGIKIERRKPFMMPPR
jgi:hypothetical protein